MLGGGAMLLFVYRLENRVLRVGYGLAGSVGISVVNSRVGGLRFLAKFSQP